MGKWIGKFINSLYSTCMRLEKLIKMSKLFVGCVAKTTFLFWFVQIISLSKRSRELSSRGLTFETAVFSGLIWGFFKWLVFMRRKQSTVVRFLYWGGIQNVVSLAHSVLRQSSAKSHSNSGQQIATVTDDRTENSFDKDIFLASPGETIKHLIPTSCWVRWICKIV